MWRLRFAAPLKGEIEDHAAKENYLVRRRSSRPRVRTRSPANREHASGGRAACASVNFHGPFALKTRKSVIPSSGIESDE
jgi:hypothetical protein